jgi:hypothetical protein
MRRRSRQIQVGSVAVSEGAPVSVHSIISGRAIHRAFESYRGEGKTDAKDAAVIADQVRIRRDLHSLDTSDGTVTDLKILTGRRTDLVADPHRQRQPAPRPTRPHLPRADWCAGVPDPGRHPPYRRETAGDLAAKTDRSSAPTGSPRPPSTPPSASTPVCPGRS